MTPAAHMMPLFGLLAPAYFCYGSYLWSGRPMVAGCITSLVPRFHVHWRSTRILNVSMLLDGESVCPLTQTTEASQADPQIFQLLASPSSTSWPHLASKCFLEVAGSSKDSCVGWPCLGRAHERYVQQRHQDTRERVGFCRL